MITASNAAVQAQVGTILSGVKQEITQELANQIAKADDLAQKLVANAEAVTTASRDAHQRIDSQVVQANERSQQTFVEFERLRLQLGEKFDEIDGKHSDLMQRLAAFDQEIAEKQSATVVKLESSYSELVVKLQEEFANTKRYIDHVEKRITESGMTGGMGTGSENKRNKLTVKDCPVSRMSEKPDILDFRQWITTVERQLESAFGYTGIDVVLQKLRFCKEKLCREDFDSIIFQLNADSECSVTDGMQWNFDDSTRFIYNYIIGKLNKTMFEHVQNVVDHNGWEVMRLVLEKADKPPDNAVFTMNLSLSKLVIDKDGKELVCKGLKDLMAFIKTVDDASTQFQRNTGQKPDPGRLKEILWQVTDPATRIELGRLGFDGDSKSYEETFKEIKKRHDFYYPAQVILAKPGNDKMDVSAIGPQIEPGYVPSPPPPASEPTTSEQLPSQEYDQPTLDAFGKGKGKGQSDVCNRCGGKGHFARDCATPIDSTDPITCKGCGGKGHRVAACTTANPHLKGCKSGGKGQGGWSGPGGWNGKGGWNKGSWSKGYGKGGKAQKGKGKGGKNQAFSLDNLWAPNDWSGGGEYGYDDWSYGGYGSLGVLSHKAKEVKPDDSWITQNIFSPLDPTADTQKPPSIPTTTTTTTTTVVIAGKLVDASTTVEEEDCNGAYTVVSYLKPKFKQADTVPGSAGDRNAKIKSQHQKIAPIRATNNAEMPRASSGRIAHRSNTPGVGKGFVEQADSFPSLTGCTIAPSAYPDWPAPSPCLRCETPGAKSALAEGGDSAMHRPMPDYGFQNFPCVVEWSDWCMWCGDKMSYDELTGECCCRSCCCVDSTPGISRSIHLFCHYRFDPYFYFSSFREWHSDNP